MNKNTCNSFYLTNLSNETFPMANCVNISAVVASNHDFKNK